MTAVTASSIRREARIKARRRARNRKRVLILMATGMVLATSVVLAAGRSGKEMPEEQPAELTQVIPTPVVLQPEVSLYTDEDVDLIAKTIYGEALVTGSDMEMAAVAWCILNRVDSDEPFFPDTIEEVVTQNRQFHGYDEGNPVDEHIAWLAKDVLERWVTEKNGEATVGRVLPSRYLYFVGDGKHNHFTVEYQQDEEWDWSLPNPYES